MNAVPTSFSAALAQPPPLLSGLTLGSPIEAVQFIKFQGLLLSIHRSACTAFPLQGALIDQNVC